MEDQVEVQSINENQMDDFQVDTSSIELVDEDGSPIDEINTELTQNAEPAKTLEALTNKPAPAVQPQQAQPEQKPISQPIGFDADFVTEQGYEGGKALEFLTKNNDYQFNREFRPQPIDTNQNTQSEVVKDPSEELFEWKQNEHKKTLGGIEQVWNILNESGLETFSASQLKQAFDSVYVPMSKEIENNFQKKNIEFIQKANSEYRNQVKTEEENSRTEALAKQNRNIVAGKVGGLDKFNALVFGTSVNGKLNKGYGADVVDWVFEQQTDLSKLKTGDDYNKAYAQWWNKFSAKSGNLEMLVTLSKANYALKNLDKLRDSYRKQWDAERGTKNAGLTKQGQQRNRSVSPNNTADGLTAELRQVVGL